MDFILRKNIISQGSMGVGDGGWYSIFEGGPTFSKPLETYRMWFSRGIPTPCHPSGSGHVWLYKNIGVDQIMPINAHADLRLWW